MKNCYMTIALTLMAFSAAQAQTGIRNAPTEWLYEFLEGSYELIGRLPDTDITYTGKVVLTKKDSVLEVRRYIKGKQVIGTGKISEGHEGAKFLWVEFIDNHKEYAIAFQIGVDHDNYARLTGALNLKERTETKIPGLEALFIDQKAMFAE